MKVAIYCRVSTEDQTVQNQMPEILEYCKAKGWNDVEVYSENESAWKDGHQRELARLLRELRTGRRRYDYLIVYALDRLTRGGIRAIFPLLDSFENLGCKIISLKENWIPESGALRDVFISMVSWAAQYESDRKSQNTRAGLDRARANGKKLGRPKGSKDSQKRLKKRPVIYRHTSPRIKEGLK